MQPFLVQSQIGYRVLHYISGEASETSFPGQMLRIHFRQGR